MRFYKLTDEKVIESATSFLEKLEKQQEENLKNIHENITPFDWDHYFGREGGGFFLLTRYVGFAPKQELKEIPKGWRIHKEHENVLVPNARTRIGKKVRKQLDDLPNIYYPRIYEIVGIEDPNLIGRFYTPSLFKSNDETEIFFGCDPKLDMRPISGFEEVTLTYVEEKLGIED